MIVYAELFLVNPLILVVASAAERAPSMSLDSKIKYLSVNKEKLYNQYHYEAEATNYCTVQNISNLFNPIGR